jgi:hypothetical protein
MINTKTLPFDGLNTNQEIFMEAKKEYQNIEYKTWSDDSKWQQFVCLSFYEPVAISSSQLLYVQLEVDTSHSPINATFNLFVEYDKKIGCYYKDEQTRYSDTPITNGDEVHHFYDSKTDTFTSEFLIPLDNYILDKYPYVDTFCYLKDNCLSNVLNLGSERNDYKNRCFRSTSGYFELHR